MNNRVDNVYNSITKKEVIKIFLIGGLIGVVFFLMCYGWQILDVTNDGWLLSGEDISQHYIGWKFYRASAWHFPIGQIDGILYPDTSCIVFSDSIPLFAIFFKLISPILPETFQYFGIWGFVSYILVGGLSALIIRKSTEKISLCVLGSGIFCLSPYIFHRMYVHTALAGHWILIAAIAIWIYKPYFSGFWKKLWAWGSLLVIASLVHIYFIPMVMIFMFGFCFQDLIENHGWKEDLAFAPITVAADLCVLYIVGAFGKSGDFLDDGLGKYSANLNSLFNSNNRCSLFKMLPLMEITQDEGFGYLGAGVLLLLGCTVGIWTVHILHQKKKENFRIKYAFSISVWIVLALSFILAWSPTITWGQNILLEIPYPEFVMKKLAIFRASGRFIWCVGYLIMTFCIMTVCQYIKQSVALLCMAAALILQRADMERMVAYKIFQTHRESQFRMMQSDMWEVLAQEKKHLIIIPFSTVNGIFGTEGSYEMGNFAVDHGMTVNFFPLARTDMEAVAGNDRTYIEALESGADCSDCIYILDTREKGQELGLEVYEIDGCYVGVVKQ